MNDKKTSVYAGLDIAKASLQLHLQGKSYDLANTTEGHAQLIKRLAAVPGSHVICEATGGYERAGVAALHAAAIPVSVLNPARVRQFARAAGKLAKTDPIDAAMLTAFGQAFTPAPTPQRTATELKMAALVTRRAQLLELRVAETQRADTCADLDLRKLFTPWLAQIKKQIAKVEALVEALLQAQAPLASQVQRLDDIMGVGRLTAVMVLATMPELGTFNRQPAAALAGPVGWPVPSGDEARLQAIRSADLVVNATPFGMEGASPVGTAPWLVAPDLLHPGQVAADLVYAPRPTPWLIGAAAAGARSVDGLGMLVHQAAAQLVLWTGEDAPVEAMWQAAEAGDPPRDPAVPGAPAP